MVNDKGTDVDKCEKKVMKESKVAGEIKALVDTKEFNWECVKVLHESMLISFQMYGNKIREIKKEKEIVQE